MNFLWRFAVWVAVDIALWPLWMLVCVFLPLTAISKDHLPWWLSYFDTPDNTLDGDADFQAKYPEPSYWNRVRWLQRNMLYGFNIQVLGMYLSELPKIESGDIWTGNEAAKGIGRTTGQSGDVHIVCGDYWEKYHVSQWGNSDMCNRFRLGWKLSGYIQDPENYPLTRKVQFVVSWNPRMHFAN